MFMPVESLLRLNQSAICDASPRQRRHTIIIPYLRSHLRRGGRCTRFVGLVLWCIVFGVAYPPDTRGGTEEKPVGTVCFTVKADGRTDTRTLRLPGNRSDIRERSTTVAMHLLRRLLGDAQ